MDESALPYYEEYFDAISEAEIVQFLLLMRDTVFTATFGRMKADQRVCMLVEMLKSKSDNIHIQRALSTILDTPIGRLDRAYTITAYKEALKFVPEFK